MRIEFPTEQVVLGRVLEYKKVFLYLFVGVTAASLAVSYWMSGSKKSIQQFASVEEALVELNDDSIASLEGALKSHPELAGRVEGILAQHFLAMRAMEGAEKYIEKGLSRTEFAHSYYTDFARNSLLVEQKEYQKALEASNALKEKMQGDPAWMTENFGKMLFGFNLLRIAFLNQLLGEKEGELRGIEEAKSFLEGEKGKVLLEHFSDQNVSMVDYFRERESLLRN